MSETTLYEQMGGAAAVEATVSAFYERVFADPELRPFFDGVSADKLIAMQREFFTAALGGPLVYSGLSLRAAHERFAISPHELSLFTEHLLATLECTDLGRETVNAIVGRIAMQADDVIGGGGEDG